MYVRVFSVCMYACLSVCMSVTARHTLELPLACVCVCVCVCLSVCLSDCIRVCANRAQFLDDLERVLARLLRSSVKPLSTITSSLRSILVHFQLEARNV